MSNQSTRLIKLLSIIFVTALFIVLVVKFLYPEIRTRSYFSSEKTPLTATYDLFDLGIADANNDGFLDIFTLNHSARQNLLLGSESGTYTDTLSKWGLGQDREFSELEDTDRQPAIDEPGLYIYRQNFDLHIRVHRHQDLVSPVQGQFELSLPVTVKKKHLANVEIQEVSTPDKGTQTRVQFSIQEDGELVLGGFPEISHSFQLNPDIPLEQVYIGLQKEHPSSQNFQLMWRDRHSMAWADFNRDAQKDLYIARGGIRGKISELSERFSDELFINDNFNFQDEVEQWGIVKGNCPARQSAWIDYNRDDKLDIYVGCGRGPNDPKPYPNQLYRQENNGEFVDVAAEVGLDLPGNGYFYWLDSDDDGDMDLLATQHDTLQLYQNQNGKFEIQFSEKLGGKITQFAVYDYDLDGDLDVFAVTPSDNHLFVSENGEYVDSNLTSIGLPKQSVSISWVDYDNDGLPDLYTVPNGLYHQDSEHNFQETNLLDMRRPQFQTLDARCSWFDANNDGLRDLLIAYRQTPSILQPSPSLDKRISNQLLRRDTSKIWQSKFYRNIGSRNHHWLDLKLLGSPGNPQAIGAKVRVKTGNRVQFQQIGSAENSRYSQGHYRLYFGLGQQEKPDWIQVTWPDGSTQKVSTSAADRLLVINKTT